jgi:Protein of unknown function (DUF2924)
LLQGRMPTDVTSRLEQLSSMTKRELWALWKQLLKRTAPPQIRRELLIRILAFRIQEDIHGGLSAETRKRLRELARQFAANPDAELQGISRIKPGTRLIREWRGRSHHVTVLDQGYSYAGKRYSSLSQIARLITGTRWSGPLFFGLKRGSGGNGDAGRG